MSQPDDKDEKWSDLEEADTAVTKAPPTEPPRGDADADSEADDAADDEADEEADDEDDLDEDTLVGANPLPDEVQDDDEESVEPPTVVDEPREPS